MMGGVMMGGMGAWMLLWGLVGLVVLILAVVGAVLAVRQLGSRGHDRRREVDEDGPREILRRRYAAGEIDEDDYLRRMSGLSER